MDTVDGRLTDVLVTPAREAGITLVGLVELADFVRRQKTLERLQIEFAHAARISTHGELTVSIAHELNQPLGAIAVNCETSLNAAVDLPFDLEGPWRTYRGRQRKHSRWRPLLFHTARGKSYFSMNLARVRIRVVENFPL